MDMLDLQEKRFLRLFQVTISAAWMGLTFTLVAYCQVSPDDHKEHRPSAQEPQKKPAEEEKGDMMSMMRTPPQKELYPSLMELPQLCSE